MVSIFLGTNSWVARWNNLEGVKPGIYAIVMMNYDDDDYEEGPAFDNVNTKSKQKMRRVQAGENEWSDDDEYYQ